MMIREFQLNDLEEIYALIMETVEISYSRAYSGKARAFFKVYHNRDNIIDDAQRGSTLVAIAQNKVVGTGTLLGSEVRRVFVAPDRQGEA